MNKTDDCPGFEVRCRDCRHFERNHDNPHQGMGGCRENAAGGLPPWPGSLRRCKTWEPTDETLAVNCQAACQGTSVAPGELMAFVQAQGDPGWMVPAAIKRWAILIERSGFPVDPPADPKAEQAKADQARAAIDFELGF